jgi:hypothetical protein
MAVIGNPKWIVSKSVVGQVFIGNRQTAQTIAEGMKVRQQNASIIVIMRRFLILCSMRNFSLPLARIFNEYDYLHYAFGRNTIY